MENVGQRFPTMARGAFLLLVPLAVISCSDPVTTSARRNALKSEDCIICDGGVIAPPARERTGYRPEGSADPTNLTLPDPSATGPMTSAELDKFGEPDENITTRTLADAQLLGTWASFHAGVTSSGSNIVTMSGTMNVRNTDTMLETASGAVGCRGWKSCLDIKTLPAQCSRHPQRARLNVESVAYTRWGGVDGSHGSTATCSPSDGPPATIADQGRPGFSCSTEWIQVTTDGGEHWVDKLASVCVSGTSVA